MPCAVRFQHVTKTFPHHAGQILLRERLRTPVQALTSTRRFEALHDVSFELAAGESLGLIGSNGAGKSTILNLATGLALPDSGSVEVTGEVAALLELGAGFHPDLTGAENVRINAALMGLSRRETRPASKRSSNFRAFASSSTSRSGRIRPACPCGWRFPWRFHPIPTFW